MKIIYTLLLIFSLSILNVNAQSDSTLSNSGINANRVQLKHELGIGAGFSTGFGPAYRLWANRLGGQLCFTPINTGMTELYSAGFTFLFSISKTQSSNFFFYQGNHFLSITNYTAGTYEYQSLNIPGGGVNNTTVYVPATTDKDKYMNNGLGIGIELFHKDRNVSPFGFNIMCGLSASRNFTRSNFTGEMALMYKFK
jgi:hypothetical protein